MTATGASPAGHRRRSVVLVTLAVGAASLAALLRLEPGDDRFVAGAAWVAAVWGVGAVASGSVPLEDRRRAPRAVALGALVGVAAVAVCLAGGIALASVAPLREPARELLAHAAADSAPVVMLALANGVSEELFFRGALFDAVPARVAVLLTTAVYALTTAGSGVVLLTLAAVLLGALTAVLRSRTGGVLAPAAAHLVWSVGMLLLLPSVLATGR